MSVLIDVDIGLHRCGVTSAGEAVALAQAIDRSSGLRFAGLTGYEGRLRSTVDNRSAKIAQAYGILAEVREAVVGAGFQVEAVSAGGTSTILEALADRTITEIQAGVYALMEPDLLTMDLPFRCCAAIRGTVISRHPGRVILDVGRRSVGVEYGPPVPVCFEAAEVRVNDEHCVIAMPDHLPDLGSQLDLIPGQIRTTFNLHDRVWVSQEGEVVDCWPVTARGGSQ